VQSNFAHQHTNRGAIRLNHYATKDLFLPFVRLDTAPKRHGGTAALSFAARCARFAVRIAMAFALASLLLLAFNMNSELVRMRAALDGCSRMQYYHTDAGPPVVTVTATILTPSSARPTPPAVPTASAAAMPIDDPVTLPPSIFVIDIASARTTSEPRHGKSVHGEEGALLPLQYAYDWWPLRFEMPTADETMDALVSGLGTLWQVIRRIYHYPLDPP
jgi:hypothetical protein